MNVQPRTPPVQLKHFRAIASASEVPIWFQRALEKGADFDPDRALSRAIRDTDFRLVRSLLATGAGMDGTEASRRLGLNTLLISAVKKMDVAGVERALSEGADPNCRDRGLHVLVIAHYGASNEKMPEADRAKCVEICNKLKARGAVVPSSEAEQAGMRA